MSKPHTCIALRPLFIAAVLFTGIGGLELHASDRGDTWEIRVGISDQGFLGLEMGLLWKSGHDIDLGLTYRTSALALAQGSIDAGELGFSARFDAWGAMASRLPTMSGGDLSPHANIGLELGWRFQNQSLGFMNTFYVEEVIELGLDAGWGGTGLVLARRDMVLTAVTRSDFALDTFRDRYGDFPLDEEGPGFGGDSPAGDVPAGDAADTQVIPGAGGSWRLGLFADLAGQGLHLAGGMRVTDSPFVEGFDGMMFGVFPFFMNLGWQGSPGLP